MIMPKTIETGGPAFPFTVFQDRGARCDATGMTLRDYFAAHCPDSELPDKVTAEDAAKILGITVEAMKIGDHGRGFMVLRARARFIYADIMLSERNKVTPE